MPRLLPHNEPPTHPGEILLEEFLLPLGMTQTELASKMGVPVQRVNQIINGKRGVTANTAVLLARVLNTDPWFWMELQAQHDLWYALRDSEAPDARPEPEPQFEVIATQGGALGVYMAAISNQYAAFRGAAEWGEWLGHHQDPTRALWFTFTHSAHGSWHEFVPAEGVRYQTYSEASEAQPLLPVPSKGVASA